MPEHRYSHHPTAPSTSAINGNNEQSSISNSNSIPDIEQKLSSKQSTTKKQIPFSHPAQRKINSNVNSKPPMVSRVNIMCNSIVKIVFKILNFQTSIYIYVYIYLFIELLKFKFYKNIYISNPKVQELL